MLAGPMTATIAICLAAVAIGAAAGLFAQLGSRARSAARNFGTAAMIFVAALELLPEAMAAGGAVVLLGFGVGVVIPDVVTRLTTRITHSTAGDEAAFWGLVVHQALEGLAIGAQRDAGPGLALAVAGHTMPLTMLAIGSLVARHGRKAAMIRGSVLMLVTGAGLALGGAVAPGPGFATASAWVGAVTVGLLVHTVVHGDDAGEPRRNRFADVIAAAAGVAVVWGLGHEDAHGEHAQIHRLLHALWDLTLETAPMLLIGLLLGAILQQWGERVSILRARPGESAPRSAIRGVVVGAPLPICSCGVLPMAEGLRRSGAAPATVVAFLIATPELGPETLMLTARFFGWEYAIVRVAAALVVALIAGVFAARWAGSGTREAIEEPRPTELPSSWRRTLDTFFELLLHVGPWTVVGVLLAAYLEVFLPERLSPDIVWSYLAITLVSLPAYVCAASATPLAAVLAAKGVSVGAVLVGLLLGPAANVATVWALRGAYGGKFAFRVLGVVCISAVAIGVAVDASPLPVDVSVRSGTHAHSDWSLWATALLGLAVAWQVLREGPVGWLRAVVGHDHDHGHGDGHAHHHGHHHRGHEHSHDHGAQSGPPAH